MDRSGSRLGNLFQTLEKLNVQKNGSRLSADDLQAMRFSTSKIQLYVATQDKAYRDSILKSSGYLDLLLSTFESCYDAATQQSIIAILCELIGKTNTGKKASTLVAHGATHALFAVLAYEAREENCCVELLISIHQVLGKLAPKDRKFGVKARLTGALGITLQLLKAHSSTSKILQPLLPVIKHYSNNAVNASYLGKNGALSHLFKVLSTCGRKHLTSLKQALDSLALLVKSKSNSARAIGQGGVPVLLNMFYDWHKVDSKNRHVSLRKSILNVLKHLTNLKSGRDSLKEAEGIRILYTTCQESIESRELETLIFMSSVIMRKCFPRNRLPVTSLRSALTFPLPDSDFHTIDMGEGADAHTNSVAPAPQTMGRPPLNRTSVAIPYMSNGGHIADTHNLYTTPPSHQYPPHHTVRPSSASRSSQIAPTSSAQRRTYVPGNSTRAGGRNMAGGHVVGMTSSVSAGDENGYESSLDHDDDLSSDDDTEAHRADSDDELERDLRLQAAQRRTWDDLMPYKRFFPELYEFDVISTEHEEQPPDPCVPQTPTPVHASQSMGLLDTMQQGSRRNSYVRQGAGSRSASRAGGFDPWSAGAGCREPHLARGLSRLGLYHSPSDSYFNGSSTPSAVNLKTGSSVFSLDFPPPKGSSSAGTVEKNFPSKVPKGGRKLSTKSSKNNLNAKEERSGGRKGRTRTSIGARSDEDILNDMGQGCYPVTSSMMTSRTERPSFLLDSDGEANNEGDDQDSAKGHDIDLYTHVAMKTLSVGRFNKLAYPDLFGHAPPPEKEPLYEKTAGTQRQKIFEDIDRFIHTDQTLERVVYDLDAQVSAAGQLYTTYHSTLSNQDQLRVSKEEGLYEHLRFNSQFESGNLRKVIQIRQYEYDLILNPDVNTNHHHQWFYFQVSNMEAGVKYRFNIVNCEKLNSQFNFGMKPVMFSVAEAMQGRPHWLRIGSEICYYKNHYVRSAQTTGGVRGKSYYTATFTVTFQHRNDVCYLAYHYPYTYSMLYYHIYKWEEAVDRSSIFFRNHVLTTTLGGNIVPLLTITNHPDAEGADPDSVDQLKSRPYIFLTGRVHPGESNASWVMKGTIDYLLSDRPAARALRDQFIFKIVPMLNPDGVINGNHRCSLVAEDLNRRWIAPCPKLHPTIYHTKGLLQFLNAMQKTPLVYCDYHGHSRRKNVFLYGCSPSLSWMQDDVDNPAVIGNRLEDTSYKTLPKALQSLAPAFSLQNCSFMVEKAKEASARVVVWRQIRVVKSYTMESTYCGCDQGIYRGLHISTRELEEMGRKFGEGLTRIKSRHAKPARLNGSGNALDGPGIDAQAEVASNAQAGTQYGEAAADALEPLTLHSDDDTDSDDDNEHDMDPDNDPDNDGDNDNDLENDEDRDGEDEDGMDGAAAF